MPKTPRTKLCPVCGEKVTDTGNRCTLGRIILSCGDAVWHRTDKLGRVYWQNHKPTPYPPEVHRLILAAQAVCQSRNGSNPEATKLAHEKAVDELALALKDTCK